MGKDVFILERLVMYTVNPCVGEGRKYVSLIRGAAEDVYVLVFEENISCAPSHIRVAGRPFPLGLSKGCSPVAVAHPPPSLPPSNSNIEILHFNLAKRDYTEMIVNNHEPYG